MSSELAVLAVLAGWLVSWIALYPLSSLVIRL